MNSAPDSQQQAKMSFDEALKPQARKIVLAIKGIIPSFKTQKTAYGWRDKKSGKIFARPATLPEHKAWMLKTVRDLESQLRSAFQISESEIPTGATLQSLIASLPHDDRWSCIPETILKSQLCAPGEEGAEITIDPL